MNDDHQTHRENQSTLRGLGSRARVVERSHQSEPKPRLKRTGAFLLPAACSTRGQTKVTNDPVVAIAGVTGAVGAEFIATMDKRGFRVGKLKALASARSAGKTIDFRGERIVIEELTENSFDGVDIALFSAGGGISRKFAPIAVKAGAVVVDNSSAFRMDPDVPLVIPEINADRIRDHKGIIADPNCVGDHARWCRCGRSTRQNRIKRVILSTYQAASGAGAAAMEELVESTRASLDGAGPSRRR